MRWDGIQSLIYVYINVNRQDCDPRRTTQYEYGGPSQKSFQAINSNLEFVRRFTHCNPLKAPYSLKITPKVVKSPFFKLKIALFLI